VMTALSVRSITVPAHLVAAAGQVTSTPTVPDELTLRVSNKKRV
jgi:hypothetical protein